MRKRGATWSKPRWPKGSIDILPEISRGGGPAKLVEGFLRAEGPLHRLRRAPSPAIAGGGAMKAPPPRTPVAGTLASRPSLVAGPALGVAPPAATSHYRPGAARGP